MFLFAKKPILFVLPALLLMAACGSGDDGNGRATTDTGVIEDILPGDSVVEVPCNTVTPDHTVTMQNLAFDPQALTIVEGDVVQWTNLDGVPHTVTSGSPGAADEGDLADSPLLNQGDSVCYRFNEAGAFVYFCRVHPESMRDAQITIEAGATLTPQ